VSQELFTQSPLRQITRADGVAKEIRVHATSGWPTIRSEPGHVGESGVIRPTGLLWTEQTSQATGLLSSQRECRLNASSAPRWQPGG
jgi:hypothetical protein